MTDYKRGERLVLEGTLIVDFVRLLDDHRSIVAFGPSTKVVATRLLRRGEVEVVEG